jgi:hypothetical protein
MRSLAAWPLPWAKPSRSISTWPLLRLILYDFDPGHARGGGGLLGIDLVELLARLVRHPDQAFRVATVFASEEVHHGLGGAQRELLAHQREHEQEGDRGGGGAQRALGAPEQRAQLAVLLAGVEFDGLGARGADDHRPRAGQGGEAVEPLARHLETRAAEGVDRQHRRAHALAQRLGEAVDLGPGPADPYDLGIEGVDAQLGLGELDVGGQHPGDGPDLALDRLVHVAGRALAELGHQLGGIGHREVAHLGDLLDQILHARGEGAQEEQFAVLDQHEMEVGAADVDDHARALLAEVQRAVGLVDPDRGVDERLQAAALALEDAAQLGEQLALGHHGEQAHVARAHAGDEVPGRHHRLGVAGARELEAHDLAQALHRAGRLDHAAQQHVAMAEHQADPPEGVGERGLLERLQGVAASRHII